MDFVVPPEPRAKMKEGEKIDKFLDLAWAKKAVEHEGYGDTGNSWFASNYPQGFGNKHKKNN